MSTRAPSAASPTRRHVTRLVLLAAGAGLAGCTGLIPGTGQPPQLYVLVRKTTFSPELPRVGRQLLVDTPTAPAQIDTARIALSRTPLTIDYFADAAWADRAPAMVQSLLIESFEQTGRVPAVSREAAGLRADYILMSELRSFQADYRAASASPEVFVRILVRLVKMPERTIIGEEVFDRREPAQHNGMEPIVDAFNEALGGVMKRLVEWTLRGMSADEIATR